MPPGRLHPDEGVGLDGARAPRGPRDRPEARRRHGRAGARLRDRERVEGAGRQADDGRRRVALQGEQRPVARGQRRASRMRRRSSSTRAARRQLQERDRRDRLVSRSAADPGPRLPALRRLDGAARADRGAAPSRRARRRNHRLRIRVDLRALRDRGDDDRDARVAHPAGRRRRDERAPEVVRAARDRRPPRQAVHARSRTRAPGSSSTSAKARRRVRPHARRRRAARRSSRASASRRRASRSTRVRGSRPTTTAGRPFRTSTRPATSPGTGSSRTRRSARARSPRRTRPGTSARCRSPRRFRVRSTPIPRSQASGSRRRRRARSTAPRTSPSAASPGWRTHARSCPARHRAGSSRSTRRRYGELVGVVIVGPHATDLIEAAVVALDAESTIETVADGMAAHPTLGEGLKMPGWSRSAARSTFRPRRADGPRLPCGG